jgi:hypothetical protein
MRKSRQENDLNSGFCSNSFTFLFSSSIFLSNLGGTVDNSEIYVNHISSSILFSGLSLLDSRREFTTHDPIIRGSFLKINKEYAKLRKYKKKQFRQQIIDKLNTFQSNNQKEYWNLVNSLRESKRDNPEKSDIKNPLSLACFFFLCKSWSNHFSFCVFFLLFFYFFLKVRSATCWITECRSLVVLLISEVVKFISSFKKLSSLFLIFGLKKNLCKIFRTFIVPYVSIWEVLQFSIDYLSLIGCQNFK